MIDLETFRKEYHKEHSISCPYCGCERLQCNYNEWTYSNDAQESVYREDCEKEFIIKVIVDITYECIKLEDVKD